MSSKDQMKLVDKIFESFNEITGDFKLKYNKHYIGLEQNSMANNFIYFHPNKKAVIFNIKLDKTDELDEIFENSDLDMLSYDKQWRVYRVRLREKDWDTNLDILKKFTQLAKEERMG